MSEKRESLFKLQEIERQLATIRRRSDAKRREIKVQTRALAKHEELMSNKLAAIQSSQLEIDRIELDVQSCEVTLNKHREALNRAKTNKEYAAILTTINTEKADASKQESRQLQLMTELDSLRADNEKLGAECETILARIKKAEDALDAYLEQTKAEVDRLNEEREAISENIAPSALSTFERVAEHHEGEAMAPIVILNAKRDEHVCGGCNMALTLQSVIAARTTDDLQLCVSCGRILFWDDVAAG